MTEAATGVIKVGEYAVRPPRWGEWQSVITESPVRPRKLMARMLAAATGLTHRQIEDLPAAAGDELLSAVLGLMEQQRADLDLRRADEDDGSVTLKGAGVDLHLTPWTFGRRNEALQTCLTLEAGTVRLDLAAFERAMVLGCAEVVDGESRRPPAPDEISAWPVPLGEKVVDILDELNGVAADHHDLLAECARLGLRHPDLDVARLCLALGWRPADLAQLGAQPAERLLAALRALDGAQPPAPAAHAEHAGSAPESDEGEVTRIVIRDD